VEPNISSSSPLHGLLSKPFVSRSRALRKVFDNGSPNTEQPILLSATSSISRGLILVLEQVKLTGSPPLVSRSDINMDVNFVPDFVNSGISPGHLSPSPPIFFAASVDQSSPLRYARLTEDAVRDVIIAIISSPGRPWSSEAEDAMKEFKHKAPLRNEEDKSLNHLFCRAGPVTAPYWCLSSLMSSRPHLFRKETQSSKVYIIDAGSTLAGYFGLLAAASAAGVYGVHTLVIDPQPQCIEWARSAAAASGFSKSRFSAVNALLIGSNNQKGNFVRVPTVTNCRGSTTQGGFIDNIGPLNASSGFVSVPRQSLSDILKNEEDATILLLKLDAIGREKEVLDGLGPFLEAKKVLNVILELNKQRSASFLKLPSAIKAEEKLIAMSTSLYTRDLKEYEQEAVDAGALPSQAAGEAHGLLLSDEDNTIISKLYAELISKVFLDRGFECLTADRGWWSAQSPFRQGEEATQDGETLEKWVKKMSRGSEVDVWCWLPAVRRG
jgi:FkbM family methyltransferase